MSGTGAARWCDGVAGHLPAFTSSITAARDKRVKAATAVLLGDLLLAASQSVGAAAQRGRDVGDGGVQLQPEKTIWQ